MKINDVLAEGKFLAESYMADCFDESAYDELLNQSSMQNDMCIEIQDKYGRSVYSKKAFGDCIIHNRDGTLASLRSKLQKSEDGEVL